MQQLTSSVKETLTPAPDGANQDFEASAPYKAGTVSVWINGLRKIQDFDDGFDEVGGTTIRLREAPLVGDTVQAQYEPA